MNSKSPEENLDLALLIIRVGVGLSFIWFLGSAKLAGGAPTLTATGAAVSHLGITAGFYWFGLAAACGETFGGLCLALGLFFRPAALVMMTVMIVATIEQFSRPMPVPVHSIVDAFLFVGLSIIGPGHYSLDRFLFSGPRQSRPHEVA